MYLYDTIDHQMVRERLDRFKDQIARRIKGELTEDQFKPLRLMNGLYLQLHAYMLRVAIPYGVLNSRQMQCLARIARQWDKGYGHFTTRQNIQYNWPKLSDVPEILEALAGVEMHAIQTSGNCIRNVTADHFAGAARDEVADPRPYAELIRQWSTLHPEFSFLPRKFKIAITGAVHDRAAVQLHDIGLHLKRDEAGGLFFSVYIGGGMGRTPFIGPLIRDHLPVADLLSYLEAALRVYNRYGRRDNIYKARIKILVAALGAEKFAAEVEAEWQEIKAGNFPDITSEIARISQFFAPPAFVDLPESDPDFEAALKQNAHFARFARTNIHPHRQNGYACVTMSLKPIGGAPGDATADQIDAAGALARQYSFDEIRVTHEQNLVLPHVRQADLFAVWQALCAADLATPNAGLVTDIIACPGLDFCDLANARSIPIAQAIAERFADMDQAEAIGELKIKISGCINACGHHHAGHIGILGVDKKGEEFYQIQLGGRADEKAAIGVIAGRGLAGAEVPDAIERVVEAYLARREHESERFIDTLERIGRAPFESALYAAH